jgi:hypothetical protein
MRRVIRTLITKPKEEREALHLLPPKNSEKIRGDREKSKESRSTFVF